MNALSEARFNSLPVWDGTAEGITLYKYPEDDIQYWDMRQADDGTVYYRNYATPREINIWCRGSELTKHLHHLFQIFSR